MSDIHSAVTAQPLTDLEIPVKEKFNFFIYALLFYAFTVAYIIPFNTTFPYGKIFLPLLVIILLLQYISQKTKLSIADVIVFCSILIVSVLNFSQSVFLKQIAPTCLILMGFQDAKPIKINRNYLKFLQWYAIPSIIYQLITTKDGKDVANGEAARAVLSNGDSNVSSLFMLLFFYFCFKNNFKIGMALSLLCAYLFSSRNFLYALVVFLLIFIFENRIAGVLAKINFPILFLLCNLCVLLLSVYWVANVKPDVSYEFGANRVLSVNDASNFQRFQANDFLLKSYLGDLNLALLGFKDKYSPVFHDDQPCGLIHNSLLQLTAILGIVTAPLYFYIVLSKMNKFYRKENFKYIYSYAFFTLFLHSSLEGPLLQVFILVLSMSSYSKNQKAGLASKGDFKGSSNRVN